MATRTVVTKHKWQIDNVEQRLSRIANGGSIFSSIFSLNDKSGAQFSMKLQNNGVGWNVLYLVCNDIGQHHELKLNLKNWLEDFDRKTEFVAGKDLVFNKSGDIKILLAYEMHYMSKFATYDALFICCEIQKKEPISEVAEIDPENVKQELAYRKKVGQNMLELHSNGHFDITIQVEDKKFYANKFTLMAHSDVFERMFSCPNSTEAHTGIINIEDSKPEVIDSLIRWIYHVEVLNINEVAAGLYRVADKYGIGLLKEQCMKVMITDLSIEHFPGRLILSYIYNEEQLKSQILSFIREDSKKVQNFMDSNEWAEFSANDPEMRKKILADIFESLY